MHIVDYDSRTVMLLLHGHAERRPCNVYTVIMTSVHDRRRPTLSFFLSLSLSFFLSFFLFLTFRNFGDAHAAISVCIIQTFTGKGGSIGLLL